VTQALISTRSKAKYYDPHNINDHTPDVNATERDELGLVRAISVKVSIKILVFLARSDMMDNILGTFFCTV